MWSSLRKIFHRTDQLFVDFGASQTSVVWDDQAIQEPSVIGLDFQGQPVAFGKEVWSLWQSGQSNIVPENVLKESGLGQLNSLQAFTGFLRQKFNIPHARSVFVSAPMDLTEVEIRGFNYLFSQWGDQVHLIPQLWLEAIGLGWHPLEPHGTLVIHAGAGYVEVAALSLFETIGYNQRQGGFFHWVQAWQEYLRQKYDFVCDFFGAESYLRQAARLDPITQNLTITLKGYKLPRHVQCQIELSIHEIRSFLIPLAETIVLKTQEVFSKLPPEIVTDILNDNAFLAGGMARIPGLKEFLSSRLNIPLKALDEPEKTTMIGWNKLSKNPDWLDLVRGKIYVD